MAEAVAHGPIGINVRVVKTEKVEGAPAPSTFSVVPSHPGNSGHNAEVPESGFDQETAQNPSSAAPSELSRSFSNARLRICRIRSRVTPSRVPISSSVRSSPSSRP